MTAIDAVTLHRLRFREPVGARVVWPASFGRRYLVTVDVEEEFDWTQPFSRAARGVTAVAALPAMHARLRASGAAPLYLIDHPVATDRRAAETVAALAREGAEVGAQLHPWVNPPHIEATGEWASFAGNLSPALEAAKLDVLTDAIQAVTGTRPRAFRAGRYGLGPATLRLLAKRGYRVDTSMRALHDYRATGGADFGAIGGGAFRIEGLLELPLSTIDTGVLRRIGPSLHRVAGHVPKGRGLLARAGLLSRVPLSPEGISAAEAVTAIRVAAADERRLLVLSFHSPSLVPGHTPYVRDATDRAAFDRWWDMVLHALADHDYAPASLSEILAASGGAVVGPAGLEPAT